MGCNKDCLNCQMDKCILDLTEAERKKEYQKQYRETHKEGVKEANRKWREKNREYLVQKNRDNRRRMKEIKMSKCSWCGGETKTVVIKYHWDYFCSERCLGEFLVNRAKDDIEKIERNTVC